MLTKQDKFNILYHYYLLRVLNAQFLAAIFMIVQTISKQILWHMTVQAQLKLILLHFQQHQSWQLTIILNALGLKVVNNKVIILKL